MYNKLGKESRQRLSLLRTQTKELLKNEYIVTTEARAKEIRKFADKMITYGKRGSTS